MGFIDFMRACIDFFKSKNYRFLLEKVFIIFLNSIIYVRMAEYGEKNKQVEEYNIRRQGGRIGPCDFHEQVPLRLNKQHAAVAALDRRKCI